MTDEELLQTVATAARELEPLDEYEITRALDGCSTSYARVMRPYLLAVRDPAVVLGLLEDKRRFRGERDTMRNGSFRCAEELIEAKKRIASLEAANICLLGELGQARASTQNATAPAPISA